MVGRYTSQFSFGNIQQIKKVNFDQITKEQRNREFRKQILTRKKIYGLSLDFHPQKNSKISPNKNKQGKNQLNELIQLRQEVLYLKMQNQQLKEHIKVIKNIQFELKFEVKNLKTKLHVEFQKRKKAEIICKKLQQKLQKYSEKIKQLFQDLIKQKKKIADLDPQFIKFNINLSPFKTLSRHKIQQQDSKHFQKSPQKPTRGEQIQKQKLTKFQNYQKHNRVNWSLSKPNNRQSFVNRFQLAKSFDD